MSAAQLALDRLVSVVGEEQAAKLVEGLANLVSAGQRPYDEVVSFLWTPRPVSDDLRGAMNAIATSPFDQPLPVPAKLNFGGGRPNRLEIYEQLYREATDKEAVLRLAEKGLRRTSYYQLRKKLGLVGK